MKMFRSLFATTLFFTLLALIYYVHVIYLPVNVVFYAAIVDGLAALFLTAIPFFLSAYFWPLSRFEKAQLLVIWLLLGYAFAISVPTVIDRSLSFYILEKLQQRGGGIKLTGFEQVFTKEYMNEYRLIDVRLTEQLESGTITIVDGCVKLTEKGRKIAVFSSMFRQNFLAKHRLLMGTYTDELTDPFRRSAEQPDYICQ